MGRAKERLRQLLNEITATIEGINVEHSTFVNSHGRMSKKITIEYDIQDPTNN